MEEPHINNYWFVKFPKQRESGRKKVFILEDCGLKFSFKFVSHNYFDEFHIAFGLSSTINILLMNASIFCQKICVHSEIIDFDMVCNNLLCPYECETIVFPNI